MRRIISPIDWIVFGGIFLLGVGALILVLITPQPWPIDKCLACFIPLGVLILLPIIFFIRKWLARPDYMSAQGTWVWVNGKNIPRYAVSLALDVYATEAANFLNIEKEAIKKMLFGVRCEFTTKPISAIGIGWAIKDKMGLQWNKKIMVYWNGKLSKTALFHELNHMVDQYVLLHPVDYTHKATAWWHLADVIIPEKFKIVEEDNTF